MRRLGSELGLQPGALYHHFPSKQALLAAVADKVLARGRQRADVAWDALLVGPATSCATRCSPTATAPTWSPTVYAFGLGAPAPAEELEEILATAGFADPWSASEHGPCCTSSSATPSRSRRPAGPSAGAIDGRPGGGRGTDFDLGLGLVLDGLAAHAPEGRRVRG